MERMIPIRSRRSSPRAPPAWIVHRTLKTTGITESALSQILGNIEELLQGTKLAFLPSPMGVRLRITVADEEAGATAA